LLRLKIKTKINSRVEVKCEKHRLYNPEKDGRGGIKGNCARCLHLLAIYNTFLQFTNGLRDYQQMTAPYEKVKPRAVPKPAGTSEALDKAFKTLLPKD
jgi:hypothetical protein